MTRNFFRKIIAHSAYFAGGALFAIPVMQLLPTKAQIEQPVAQLPTVSADSTSTNFITAAVEQASPSVVRITSAGNSRAADRQPARGMGSGFIISSDGVVLTNAHVVRGAQRVTVTLGDGRSLIGEILGQDPLTDVAVVKLPANNLPALPLGNSQTIQPGEWAIAIGNPLGLNNTVTAGIISGTGRPGGVIGSPNSRVNFIQTDAAINPGNSGGPLLNQQGEVIGINTAIIGRARGLGFAIPIDQARNIAEELIATGEVQHPYLGVQMVTLDSLTRERLNRDNLNIQADEGVVIVEVANASPAARAGLRSGDIIEQIGDRRVLTTAEVQQAVAASSIGEDLAVQIARNGRRLTIAVQPGQFPS
ncbi:trypsin-like peptidase domain-containing protein [Pleurocapsales cyanobacterium LEGE 10410]|nr:trypsin-like peptidase domain-containing protein [Pleurocapsales cyanobacterium LEGE 10410]